MSTIHVHHDVVGSTAAYRAALAAAIAAAHQNARNDRDRTYIDLQAHFHELLVISAELTLSAENDGADDAQLAKALALTMGTLQAQNLLNFLARGRGELYQETYMNTVASIISGTAPPNTTNAAVKTMQLQGSRA